MKGAAKPTLFHPFPWEFFPWNEARGGAEVDGVPDGACAAGCDSATPERAAGAAFHYAGAMPDGFSCCYW